MLRLKELGYEAGLADKSALTSATVQADELVPQIESAHRAYLGSSTAIGRSHGDRPSKSITPRA